MRVRGVSATEKLDRQQDLIEKWMQENLTPAEMELLDILVADEDAEADRLRDEAV